MNCFYCNTDKPETLFRRTTGKKHQCKACYSSYISNYIKSRPDKVAKNREYVKRSKPSRRKLRKQFLHWIKSVPCLDCGVRFHPEVMEFDHVGPKTSNVGLLSINAVSEERIWNEMLQCEIVCANCHRIRTVKRRIGEERYWKEVDREGIEPVA